MSTITLRKILLCNYIYILILFIVIVFSIPRLFINKTFYKEGLIKEEFIIKKITISDLKINLILKNKETVIGTYYFKTKKEQKYFENNYKLGDKILISGELYLPKENTSKYLFNYKKYLSTKNIYHQLKINSYKKIKGSISFLFCLIFRLTSYR